MFRRSMWALLLVGGLLWAEPAVANDAAPGLGYSPDFHLGTTAPPVEPPPPFLREYVPGLADRMKALPPFLRDTQVNLHLRTFYFNRLNADSTQNEAWAGGGWLGYKSGWLLDTFRIGVAGYTSQPLYAPSDKDGTPLLGPGQSSLLTLGQAYAQLRYEEYALLTGYRQLVNEGYTNANDYAMIPNTFEGVTLAGTLGPVGYYLGYLTAIKPLNSDEFVSMAEQAGVPDHNRGQLLASLKFVPLQGLDVYLANYLVPDLFNTAYGNAEYKVSFTDEWSGTFGLQLTGQRSTGEQFLGDFSTWNVGARTQLNWRGLTFIAAMSATGAGAELNTPYGSWPGYLSLIQLNFDRANEKAWGAGITYDWGGRAFPGARVPGLSMLLFYAQGTHARDAVTGASLPTRREGDLDIIWRVRQVKGLQFRFRNAYAGVGGPRVVKDFWIILDYELPGL